MNSSLILLLALAAVCAAMPQNFGNNDNLSEAERLERERIENESAKYKFSSDVVDNISDQTQHRQEVRDGLNVRGSYSYSDGFNIRTVEYESDKNGFRIISEKSKSLSGPNVNPVGTAEVHMVQQDGIATGYRIQGVLEQ